MLLINAKLINSEESLKPQLESESRWCKKAWSGLFSLYVFYAQIQKHRSCRCLYTAGLLSQFMSISWLHRGGEHTGRMAA